MRFIESDLRNKTILITGGAGFVGSNLAFYFQENYPEAKVVVLDSFRSGEKWPGGNEKSLGHFRNLIGFKGEVISGNINHKEDLDRLRSFEFDYVFHQAAISDTTVMDQELMLRSNTNAFKDLLDMAVDMCASMIYASSAGTYGNSPAPNSVGSGEEPENVYGFSKLMMDNLAYDYMKRYPRMTIVGLRYFNVYGPREIYKGKTGSMIMQLGLQALKNGKVRLFKHGEQMRDFVYVKDVVQANVRSIEASKSGVYNVGCGNAKTFNDVVAALKESLGTDFEVEYIDNPYTFYQNHTEADIAAAREFLGYDPMYSLEAGVMDYTPEIKMLFEKGMDV